MTKDATIEALVLAVDRMERHATELRGILQRAEGLPNPTVILNGGGAAALREVIYDLESQAAAHRQTIARLR